MLWCTINYSASYTDYGNNIPGVRNVLTSIVPFLCPLMMLLMIPMILRGNKEKQLMHNHGELKEIEDKTGQIKIKLAE